MENTTKPDCIFCQIGTHAAEARVVFENESCIAFWDIHPEASTHVLVIPKVHIEAFSDFSDEQDSTLLKLMRAVISVIHALKIENNCKIAINNGREAGQIVPHAHIHVLSTQKSD
ncbi:MAG: HIT domain-containing protein [Patescibacteria group bacterium]|jgi:histidine triad (HIT) family protein